MSVDDAGAGEAAAWFRRAAVPGLADTAGSAPGVIARDEELAAIVLRAAQIGIPAWRVMVALGIALPQRSAT